MQFIINLLEFSIKILVIAVLCIWLPIILWLNPLSIESSVKIIGLLISWPVVVAFISIMVLTRFRESIDAFLRNIRSVSFPGGNVQTQTAGPAGAGPAGDSPVGGVSLTSEQQDQIRNYIKDLQKSVAASSAQQIDLQRQLSDAQYFSYMWKFSYLNLFYIPITKQILFWLSTNQGQSIQNFHLIWQPQIPDQTQRDTILDVLIHFGMLHVQDSMLSVTQEGQSFLQYLGFKPSTPKSQ